MSIKTSQILLFKKEATAGVAEALDGTNVIETVDGITVAPYEGDRVTRNVDSVQASAPQETNKNPHQKFDFNIDMAGSGTRGSAVAYGPLLETSGFVRTEDATPGSEYEIFTLTNEETPTVTLARYMGNELLQQTAGCRGNVNIDISDYFRMSFSYVGDYRQPVSSNFPGSLNYAGVASPLTVNKQNTVKILLDGYACELHSMSLSCGTGVNYRNRPGGEKAVQSELYAKGQMTITAPKLADKNFFDKVESHNGVKKVSFEIEHGTQDGNRINISAVEVQLSNMSESDADGELAYQFDIGVLSALILKLS